MTTYRSRGGPVFLERDDERFAVVPEVVTTELRAGGPLRVTWSWERPSCLYVIDRAGVSLVWPREREARPVVLATLLAGLVFTLLARRK